MLLEEGRRPCSTCGELKLRSEFRVKGNQCSLCRSMSRQHREHSIKLAALATYSKGDLIECECCGEHHTIFLSIDHIEGGGRLHRAELGGGGGKMYWWLASQGFPEGYRVLCHNCNQAYGNFGYCPHNREREAAKAPSVGERPSVGPEAPLDETKAAPEIYT